MTNFAPDEPLTSYLHSYTSADCRARVGSLGMLRLLDPTRTALRAYERQAVAAARDEGKSWAEIAEALHEPTATVYRRWKHLG
jgi:hypothetical protein